MISIADLILAGVRVWDPNRIDTKGNGKGWGSGNGWGNGEGNGNGSGGGMGWGGDTGNGYGSYNATKPEPPELRWSL